MGLLYTLFKFLHVAAVIVWLGGLVAISLMNARLAGEDDPTAMAVMAHASRFFGSTVVGPAAGVTLLAGLVMVLAGGMSLATLWIAWGLGGLFLSMALSTTLIRRTGEELNAAHHEPNGDQARVPGLQRRLRALSGVNLLILFSAVAAMVFKPTL